MRILLKELLNVTEQAPQPQQPAPGQAPNQPAKPAAPAAVSAPAPDPALDEPTEDPNTDAPAPSDPGEYDFTRDFRAFEDSKNKAEAAAKKKLLDKMNKNLLGKKIIANASRGYGQPKTDYTIESVKKVSVEFWYKDWVVIISDENDKKFFLTPGVNIKIESGSEQPPGAPVGDPTADQAPAEPSKAPEVPPTPDDGGQPPAPEEPAPAAPEAPAPESPAPEQPAPAAPQAPAAAAAPAPLKKKKKLPVAEETEGDGQPVDPKIAQSDLGRVFGNYFNKSIFNIAPYLKSAKTSGKDQDGAYSTEYVLEIPKEILGNFEKRDFALEFRDDSYHSGGPGQAFGRGSVNIQDIGRMYKFIFNFSGGLDI